MPLLANTVNGLNPMDVISALQKCIRRGLERQAMELACEMIHTSKAYCSMVANRLELICHEDIGLANPDIIPVVATCCEQARRFYPTAKEVEAGKFAKPRMLIGTAIRLMCRSAKSREGDHFQAAVGLGQQLERKVPVIPEWAYDMHTHRGAAAGSGIDEFLSDSTRLDQPADAADPYQEEAHRLWRLKHAQGGGRRRALVVPSNDVDRVAAFCEAWQELRDWDHLILIEDAPQRSTTPPGVDSHYSWAEIDQMLPDGARWIISRRDSAIRSAGFYFAYAAGYEVIATLDDDCYPRGGGFIAEHVEALAGAPRWTPSVPGHRTRGIPYLSLGTRPVALNMGLWAGIPDLDAVQALSGASIPETAIDPDPPAPPSGGPPGRPFPGAPADPSGARLVPHNRVIPAGQFFPLCGMNLAFRREFAPLMYFGLQGEGCPYRRFDDIWCGLWAKHALDALGQWVTVGRPVIEHRRASHPMVNLVKEAPGIAANEQLWQRIDAIDMRDFRDPRSCMRHIGYKLGQVDDGDDYWPKLGAAIQQWTELF